MRNDVSSLRSRADVRRSRILTALAVPAIVAIAPIYWSATAVGHYSTQLLVQFCGPLFLMIPLAALCPNGVSSAALPYVLSVNVVLSALTMNGAIRKWMEMSSLTATERHLRGLPFFALCPMQWCGMTANWASGGALTWPSVRLVGVLFFTLRLAANLALAAWCEPSSYPPGHLRFSDACACCAFNWLANLLLTQTVRRRLSAALGCSTFIVGLKDLAADNLRLADIGARNPDVAAAAAAAAAGGAGAPSTIADSDGHALPPPDRVPLPTLAASAAYRAIFEAPPSSGDSGEALNMELPVLTHPQPHHQPPPHQALPMFLQHIANGAVDHSYTDWVRHLQQRQWRATQQQHLNLDEARADLAATGAGAGGGGGGGGTGGRAESVSSESSN